MADAMDSKSISRKGVGVRLPSLAPASEPDARSRALESIGRELGAEMWTQLARELVHARAELEALLAEFRRDRGRGLGDERLLARQAELEERAHRAGWC